MHPQIEKLELLLAQGKVNPAAFNTFFDELWLSSDSLPRPEMRKVIDQLLEWLRSQATPQPVNLALATLASGFSSFFEGNFAASLLELAEARKLLTELNDTDAIAAAMVMEGCDYRTLGEMELALKELLDAYPVLSQTNRFKPYQCFCLYQIAEIYSETGQLEDGLIFHQKCEKFILTNEPINKVMLARTYNGLGLVYQHQKKYSLALDYFNRSLTLTEEINALPIKARGLTDLGTYYFEMGDYAAAADCQKQAMAIRNEMNIPSGSITNMIQLAEIAIKFGRQDEAIEWLNKALPIAEEIKVKQKMFQIHLMLSDIYQVKGDLMKSLFHHKAFHNIREDVQHEDNEKKIKNLKLIFEGEQTKKENAIIKAQKAEIEYKNKQLEETIHELTITKVSRKAKALTLIVGITLIVLEDPIFNVVLKHIGEDNYLFSMAAKAIIILSLKPIDNAIENYLLRRIVLKKKLTFY